MKAETKSRAFFAVVFTIATLAVGSVAQAESFFRPFGRFGLSNFPPVTPSVLRVIRQDNQGRTQDIPGFANLQKQGNQLLGRDNFGRLFRLTIDGFGRLIANGRFDLAFSGQVGQEILKQAKQFFLQNISNFRGGNLGRIQRFLFRNGSGNALFGNLSVDMTNGAMPQYANMKGQDCLVRCKGLNFLLNEIADVKQRVLFRANCQQGCRQGRLNLNLRGLIRPEMLALLENDNPKACGNPNRPMDLGWLIDRAMEPDIYYQLIGMPGTLNQKAQRFGIFPDKRQTGGNKVVVTSPPDPKATVGGSNNPQSSVGLNRERLLEVQPTRNIIGGYCLTSFDNPQNNAPGINSDGTSVLKNGINATHTASEGICTKANGFFSWDLFNLAGQIQQTAPGDVALAGGTGRGLGQVVRAPAACMTCHDNGFNFFKNNQNTGKPYIDNFANIDPAHRSFFFSRKPVFDQFERVATTVYKNAMIRADACVPRAGKAECEAVLPDFTREYRKDMDAKQCGKELGAPEATAEATCIAAMNRNGLRFGTGGRITRDFFNQNFCRLSAGLALGGVPVQRSILQGGRPPQPATPQQPGTGGQQHATQPGAPAQRPTASL